MALDSGPPSRKPGVFLEGKTDILRGVYLILATDKARSARLDSLTDKVWSHIESVR
jgi:hypothetical protein